MMAERAVLPTSDHVRALREHGYTVFDRLYDASEVASLSATMTRLHRESGSPVFYSKQPRSLDPET